MGEAAFVGIMRFGEEPAVIPQLYRRVGRRLFGRSFQPNLVFGREVQRFADNPNNPYLVSFPRTGSHWLRMLMELYFERPSLVRIFYYPQKTHYLTLHTHDLDLQLVRENVLYLYRDPVDTIYLLMSYNREDVDCRDCMAHWCELYGRHLDKWLHQEGFTKKKTLIRYENLKQNLDCEFGKVCAHFDIPLDVQRLALVSEQVSKERLKQLTHHNPRVVTTIGAYARGLERFRTMYGAWVWETLLRSRGHLAEDLR